MDDFKISAKRKTQTNRIKMKSGTSEYRMAHRKVERERGKPSYCSICGTKNAKRFEWANLSGDYNNVDDYERMCKKCHYKFDADRGLFDKVGLKGRHGNNPKGEKCYLHKLKRSDVIEIKKALKNGEAKLAIARIYNVTDMCIHHISTGRTWKHIK